MPSDPADDREARWERLRASVVQAVPPTAERGPRHALPLELTGTLRALLIVIGVALVLTAALFWRAWPRTVEVDGAEQRSAGALLGREEPNSTPPSPGEAAVATTAVEIVVHVVGRVRRPGVVRLRPGARVADAVRAAGGLRAGTDPTSVNLARLVVDGEQVVVASAKAVGGPAVVGAGGSAAGDAAPDDPIGAKLDLNAATAQQLEALDGIGPVLAERIVSYRTENGRFVSIDDLRQVSGIGPKIFAAISDQVRV